MFKVTETPLQYISSTQNNSTLKDISLSSNCLKPKDPTPNSQENGIGCTTDDTEINIFDAHKYFSESNDSKDIKGEQPSHDLLSVPRLSSVSSVDGYCRNFRTRFFRATPTASSEASWNSRTGLLANPPGLSNGVSLKNLRPDHRNKRWSAAKKWFFGRKCCCSGEKSVRVKEVTSDSEHRRPVVLINTHKINNLSIERVQSHKETTSQCLSKKCSLTDNIVEIHHIKAMAPNTALSLSSTDFSSMDAPRQQRISASGRPFIDGAVGFTFPILNPSLIAQPVSNPLEDSLMECFQPMHELPSVSRPPSMDNPVNARGPFNPGSPIAGDDDVGSDASSDLFEIESFSIQTTSSYPMYRRRDSVDEDSTYNARRYASANGISNIQQGGRSLDEPPPPSVAATECDDPPSEVSIDWSVTKAEANLSPSASEIGDFPAVRRRQEEEGGDGDGKRKGNGLMVMSCRQEKAVTVGPPAVKCAAEGPPMLPLHVGGRPPRANKPPLGSSHSARLSLAFAA